MVHVDVVRSDRYLPAYDRSLAPYTIVQFRKNGKNQIMCVYKKNENYWKIEKKEAKEKKNHI